MEKPKITFFDCECSNLKGNIGRLLSFGWKDLGEKKAHVVGIDDFPLFKKDPINDKHVAETAYDVLSKSDVVVAHYGKFFDIPFINTRLLASGHAPLPPVNLVDTWLIAKKRLALNSNRLATLTQFFHLPSKTPISWDDWARAQSGDRKALAYVKEHNVVDVEVLEMAYLKMRSLWPEHPRLRSTDRQTEKCKVCGSEDTHKINKKWRGQKQYHQHLCDGCGHYFMGGVVKVA